MNVIKKFINIIHTLKMGIKYETVFVNYVEKKTNNKNKNLIHIFNFKKKKRRLEIVCVITISMYTYKMNKLEQN